ncbi:hypothetical protein Ocin01_12933, partial [Orchesella cincta]
MTPCVHKCCGLDEVYSFGNDDYPTGCQPVTRGLTSSSGEMMSHIKWKPTFYHDLTDKLSKREMSKLNPHFIQRYPSNFKHKCKTKKTTVFPFGTKVADYLSMVTGKPFKNLELRKDGWLLYPFRDSSGNEIPVINRIQAYCIDGAQHYGEEIEFRNLETQAVLFLCSGGVDEGKKIKRKRKKKKPFIRSDSDFLTKAASTSSPPTTISTTSTTTTTTTIAPISPTSFFMTPMTNSITNVDNRM